MTSRKKIDANRRNGRRGRGPRTVAGKIQSRANALKHGLSIPISAYRERQEELLVIARAIAGKDADNAQMEQARIIAESELDIQRIQSVRTIAIELAVTKTDAGSSSAPADGTCNSTCRIDAEGAAAAAFVRALPALKQIERYERRAYSRRKKAQARLKELQVLRSLTLSDS